MLPHVYTYCTPRSRSRWWRARTRPASPRWAASACTAVDKRDGARAEPQDLLAASGSPGSLRIAGGSSLPPPAFRQQASTRHRRPVNRGHVFRRVALALCLALPLCSLPAIAIRLWTLDEYLDLRYRSKIPVPVPGYM